MILNLNSQTLVLIIRIISLVLRALLFLILAILLSEEEVGRFSIFQNLLLFSQVLIGFDIYTYYTREIIKFNKKIKEFFLMSVLSFILINFFVFAFVVYLLDVNGILQNQSTIFFLIILFVESINQEIYRIFIARKKQTIAYISLFFRSSFWIAILLLYVIIGSETISLFFVYALWLCSSFLALVFSTYYVLKEFNLNLKINFSWLVEGLKIGSIYLLSSLSLKLLFVLDKLAFSQFFDEKLLGVYALYSSVGMGIYILTETIIYNFKFQDLVKHADSREKFIKYSADFFLKSLIALIFFTIFAFILIEIASSYLTQNLYTLNKSLGFIVVAAFSFWTFTTIPHYFLYAKNRNFEITLSNIFAIISLIFLIYFNFLEHLGTSSIPLYIMISLFISFTIKSYFCMKIFK